MRDMSGFVDTRYRLLQLRSNNRNNWIAFAIAHHLDGNHELCVQILSAYESTLVSSSSSSRILQAAVVEVAPTLTLIHQLSASYLPPCNTAAVAAHTVGLIVTEPVSLSCCCCFPSIALLSATASYNILLDTVSVSCSRMRSQQVRRMSTVSC